jgi:hypothetical protein
VQGNDFGSERVIFRIVETLVDSNLEVEVGRFDRSETVFAGIGKLFALIPK